MTAELRGLIRWGLLAVLGAGVAALALLGGAVVLRGVVGSTPAGASGTGMGTCKVDSPTNTSQLDLNLMGAAGVALGTKTVAGNREITYQLAGSSIVNPCTDTGDPVTGTPQTVSEITSIQVTDDLTTLNLTVDLAGGPFGLDGETDPLTGMPAYLPCSINIDDLVDSNLSVINAVAAPIGSVSGPFTTGVFAGVNGIDMAGGACSSPDLTDSGTIDSYNLTTSASSTSTYTLSAQGSPSSPADGTGGPVTAKDVTLTDSGTHGDLVPGDPATGMTDTLNGNVGTTIDESAATSPVTATLAASSGTLTGGYGGVGTVAVSGQGLTINGPTSSSANVASFAAVTTGVTVGPTSSTCASAYSATDNFQVTDASVAAFGYVLCDFNNITGSSSGSNIMTAGSGTDTFSAAGGTNTMMGGSGTDSFTASGGSNTLTGGSGNDTFTASGNMNTFTGGTGTGTDQFTATGNSNKFTAGSTTGTQTFIASGSGSDTFAAGSSNGLTVLFEATGTSPTGDTLDFSLAPTALVINDDPVSTNDGVGPDMAKVGTSTYTFSDGQGAFTTFTGSTAGGTTFYAGPGIITFNAQGNGNNIHGGTGTDHFSGVGTNDTFFAGALGNEFYTETGTSDSIDFSAAPAGLTINDATGIASATGASYTFSDGQGVFTTITGPSGGGAIFTAGSDDITFNAQGNNNHMTGGTGTDIFKGVGTGDQFIAGSSGNETFTETGTGASIDFSAAPAGLTINDATGSATGTGVVYSFSDGPGVITTIKGPTGGGAIFTAGSNNITFNAQGGDNQMTGGTGTDIFTSAGTGDMFIAGTLGNETFTEAGTGASIDFSAAPAGLIINDATGSATGTGVVYSFSDGPGVITTIKGPSGGRAIFTAGSNNITFTAQGSGNNIHGGTGTDIFSGSGTTDTFFAGPSGNETFTETGSNDSIDFSAAPAGLNINDATGSATGTAATYTFSDGQGVFTTITGPSGGGAVFTAGSNDITFDAKGNGNHMTGGSGTDKFNGSGTSDEFIAGPSGSETFTETGTGASIDFSAGPAGLSIDDSAGAATGTAATYSFSDGQGVVTTIIGPSGGGAIFTAGSDNITFDAQGNGNTIHGGTGTDHFSGAGTGDTFFSGPSGSEFFTETGSGDTIDFSAAPEGLSINDATGSAAGTGATYTFSDGQGVFTTIKGPGLGGATFTAGSDDITFDARGNGNTMTGGSGTDTFNATGNMNIFNAGSGTDVFSATGNTNTFVGSTGSDHFNGNGTGDTFVAGSSGSETFTEAGTGANIDFSAAPAGLTINDANGSASATGATYSFSDGPGVITTIKGPSGGGAVFTAGSNDITFTAQGNGNHMTGGTGTDHFNGNGTGDTFIAGTAGTEVFVETGTGASIDFSAAPAGLSIDDSDGSATGTGATYSFSDGQGVFTTITGPSGGGAIFTAGSDNITFDAQGNGNKVHGGTGTDHFNGAGTNDMFFAGPAGTETFTETGSGDSIDFSAAPAGLTINDATGTASGTGAFYTFSTGSTVFTTITGPHGGGAIFTAGSGNITFNAQGNGNNMTGGAGTDTFIATGNSNVFNAGSGTDVFSATGNTNTFVGSTGTDHFNGDGTGDTFVAGPSGSETFTEAGTGASIDFSASPAGLTINDATGSATGTGATYTFSDGQGVFTTITGPSSGGAIFTTGANNVTFNAQGNNNKVHGGTGTDIFSGAGTGDTFFAGASGTETFTETGSGDSIDFSAAPAALTINDTTGSATGTGATYTFTDGPSVFTTITGPLGGGATFTAGSGNLKFTAQGNGNQVFVGTGNETLLATTSTSDTNTLDFSLLPVPLAGDPGVDISVNEVGGVISGTVMTQANLGLTDTFTGYAVFNGTLGADTFAPNFGTYVFNGCPAPEITGCIPPPNGQTPDNDVLDLSSGSSGQTVTLGQTSVKATDGSTTGSESIACTSLGALSSSTCTSANNVVVSLSNVGTVLGSKAGGTDFVAGAGTFTLTGQGTSGNELDLTHTPVGVGVIVSLVGSTNTVCAMPSSSCGWGDTITFGNMQTVTGTPYNDVFLPGQANVTIGGCGPSATSCGDDTVSFAGAPTGVTVNLNNAGTATNPVGLATGGWGGTITLDEFTNVIGSPFNDVITGDSLPGTIIGGAGNDTFIVTGGNDTIDGGTGSNTLSLAEVPGQASVDLNDTAPQDAGGAGILTIVGGTIQTLIASQGGSDLSAGTGSVTLEGGAGNDWLGGGSGTQTLMACAPPTSQCGGNDILQGGVGTQNLIGGGVPVTFEPGQGNETLESQTTSGNVLDYASAPSGVFVNLSGNLFTVPAPSSVPGFTPITLPESGQSIAAESATGGYGGNVNLGTAGITEVFGTAFSDVIVTSSSGSDQLSGGGGNDLLVADGGNNVLTAGGGTLTFFLLNGSSDNVINGGGDGVIDEQLAPAGANVNLQTGVASGGFGGSDSLAGVLSIIGTQFNDILVGNGPGGTIIGLNGNDLIEGGPSGGETLVSGGGGNTTFCASLFCQLSGTNASDAAGTTGDLLIGGSGDDTFFVQNSVVDTVVGGSGFDEAQVDPGDKLTNIAEILPSET